MLLGDGEIRFWGMLPSLETFPSQRNRDRRENPVFKGGFFPSGHSRRMKRPLKLLLICSLVLAAAFGLSLLIGVWLPDVIYAREHILAEQRLPSGHLFRVVQYWNHVDFYSTELRVTSPDGRTQVQTLDGDDNKSWRLPLVIDEQHHTATITLGGNRVRTVDWR